eukprot:scaffold935_cov222-Isochrysis_galbana.AAC.3
MQCALISAPGRHACEVRGLHGILFQERPASQTAPALDSRCCTNVPCGREINDNKLRLANNLVELLLGLDLLDHRVQIGEAAYGENGQ